MRQIIAASAIILLTGCGRDTVSTPTPTPTPTPTTRVQPFLIKGAVNDNAFWPIAGATVRVMDGSHSGAVAIADEAGSFTLEPTFTDSVVSVRASKPGYGEATQNYSSATAQVNGLYFKLQSLSPAPLAGNYLLTFRADPACTSLPDAVRTRTYSTTISESSRVLKLEGAVFVTEGTYSYDGIYFGQSDRAASFMFQDGDIIELVAPHSYLSIYGEARGPVSSDGGMMALQYGKWTYCPATDETDDDKCAVQVLACESRGQHTLTVARY